MSADLAVHYARAGWLNRLARGVYQRAGDPLELHPTLRMLQREVAGLHVGGKTALDWYGVRLFTDGWSSHRPPIDADELELVLAVELEASRRDPYRQLSRLFHLIARRQ